MFAPLARTCSLIAAASLRVGTAWAGILGDTSDIPGAAGTDVRVLILNILKLVLSFTALLAVIFIIVAGIRLIVSQGEQEQRQKSVKTIIYVVVGLIVILLARLIVVYVIKEIGGGV